MYIKTTLAIVLSLVVCTNQAAIAQANSDLCRDWEKGKITVYDPTPCFKIKFQGRLNG